MTENNKNPKYNKTIAPLWPTKAGGFYMSRLKINAEMLAVLDDIKEGGQFLIKAVPEEKRKSDTSPHAYLEYVTPQSVQEFEDRVKAQSGDV